MTTTLSLASEAEGCASGARARARRTPRNADARDDDVIARSRTTARAERERTVDALIVNENVKVRRITHSDVTVERTRCVTPRDAHVVGRVDSSVLRRTIMHRARASRAGGPSTSASSFTSAPRRQRASRLPERNVRSSVLQTDGFVSLASTMSRDDTTSTDDGVTLMDYVRGDGPPRFFSPLVRSREQTSTSASTKPLAVYLPGLDGTGFSAASQFEYIVNEFDLVALNVPASDRGDIFDLVNVVTSYLEARAERGDVYLIGESMGGLLSLCVASARPDLVTRLILVNPASSFDKSAWPVLGPVLPSIPSELWGALPYALTPVLMDPIRMARGIFDKVTDKVVRTNDAIGTMTEAVDELIGMLPALGALAEIIPRDTLAHRLDMVLRLGCEHLNGDDYARLSAITVPTLVVASENDNLIPSLDESERLRKWLPKAKVEVLKGASHAALQEPGVNLMLIAKQNGFLPKHSDAPLMTRDDEFDPPSPADIQRARESLATLRAITSPVFFSTRSDGKIVRGLGAVPIRQRGGRPILLVGNHQTLAPDLGFLVDEFLNEYDVCVRGLAHPVVSREGGLAAMGDEPRAFEDMFRDAVKNTPIESLLPRREPKPPRRAANIVGGGGSFATFGAVPVSGFNFFRLMKKGEAVLLFPGGVREAFKRKNEEYKLFWPSKPEFVRMAIKHNALIVPFAAVGAEDSIDIVADATDLLNAPLGIGDSVRERSQKVPTARSVDTRVTTDAGEEELFIQPVVTPKAPQRFYFRFMAPIDASEIDLNDDVGVNDMYLRVRREVEWGIKYLREEREHDPFKELAPRLLYEAATSSQAPTFTPNAR